MQKTIGIFSTLDTKAAETYYLKTQIEMRGCNTIILDLGTRGYAGIPADVTREEIFALGSGDGAFAAEDRVKLGEIMTSGASVKINELYAAGKVHGVIGIGGATNSLMETNIMRTLPFGVPKLMVCSVAASQGLASRYFGTSDIAILHSVVDFTGLNDLIRDVLERAAGSIVGMVQKTEGGAKIRSNLSKKFIAMTQLSLCERTAGIVRERLEEEGYQVIGFSATGVADKAMEELIAKENLFAAVIDLAPGGVGEQIFGGTRSAGPQRLETAGIHGIPQIIAPCAVNLMTPPRSKYKPDYFQRKKHDLDALRTFLRLNDEELLIVARAMSQKLNLAKTRVKFLIPLKGWASFDREGSPVYQPESDYLFVQELKQQVKDHVEVIELDANLDEPEFAEGVIKAFKEMMGNSILRRDAG